MGDYGIKITKDGVDAKTAADIDLVFSSKFGCFVSVKEGSGTAPAGSGDQTITIPAALDFPSAFFVYQKNGWKTNSWVKNYKSYIDASFNLVLIIPAGVDYYYVITNKTLDTSIVSKLRPSSSDYGMKVSLPGFDVKTATWDQLAFNSSNRVLQVLGSYTVGVSLDPFVSTAGFIFTAATYYEYSTAHGKPYVPLFEDICNCYDTNATQNSSVSGPSEAQIAYPTGEGPNTVNMEVCVDATNIWFRFKTANGTSGSGLRLTGVTTAQAKVWIIGGM